MAEETQKAVAPATEEVVVVSDVPVAEKSATVEKEPPPAPEPEPEEPEKPAAAAVEEEVEAEKPKPDDDEKVSLETNVVGELPDPQKKALDELKQLVQEALNKHEFTAPPPPPPAKEEEKPAEAVEEEKNPPPATEEEPKPEEIKETPPPPPPAAKEEPPKPDAPPAETKEEEEKAPPQPPSAAEEPPKPEAPPAEPKEEEEKAPPPPAVVIVAEVVEKITAVDDDGAKTVEAIEETIVSVSTPAPPPPEEPASATEPPPAEPKDEQEAPAPPEEVSIWGIPLLSDERTDAILLKFLIARDFKVKEAFAMLKNTVRWRKEFGIESLLDEDLVSADLDKVVFMHGLDKEGHPVCYNAFGEFQNKELYQNTFSDEEKRQKFLRWRIQFLEKSIRKLDYSPDGICTLVQVNDLKNSPGPFKRELRLATDKALLLLQDNYPEFVAKQVFINVPWWYLAFYKMISPFFTQRTKSKFVFAGPSKSAETLLKYIAPEQVPVQYGGLSREGEQEFTTSDPVTEEIIKPTSKHSVEFPVSDACTLVWEVRVVGWDVSYGTEFVPVAEGGYTVIIQKARKILPAEETVICGSFKSSEPGKVVLTFDNQTSKKKKLFYRSKTKPSD